MNTEKVVNGINFFKLSYIGTVNQQFGEVKCFSGLFSGYENLRFWYCEVLSIQRPLNN